MITKNGRVASLVLALVFFFCSSEAQAERYGVNKTISLSQSVDRCEMSMSFDCNGYCGGYLRDKCNAVSRNYCNQGDTFLSTTFGGVYPSSSCSVSASGFGSIVCEQGQTRWVGSASCVGSCNALCEATPECVNDGDCGENQICQAGGCEDVECTDDSDCAPGEICNGGMCEWLEEESPVLVSIGDGRFELTSWQEGVSFDLDADGFPELTAWTTAGTDDALLVLDRNHNGLIDNGSELFGNYTVQEPSDHPNGFLALALYDTLALGGDGNGVITAADWVFPQLQLWFDYNHNGVSEIEELSPFSGSLFAIDLDYHRQKRVDQHGNKFRYRTKAFRLQGGVSMAYDVFFVTAP